MLYGTATISSSHVEKSRLPSRSWQAAVARPRSEADTDRVSRGPRTPEQAACDSTASPLKGLGFPGASTLPCTPPFGKRRIRFYDLRHTCATSLLAGWWGRKWTLDELAQLLGHGSVKQTERYAHRLNEVLRRAAEGTGFHGTLTESANARASLGIRTPDLRFTNPRTVSGFSGLAVADFHERSTRRDNRLAFVMLEATRLAYRGDDRLAKARVIELLREGAELVQEGRRAG